MAKEYSPFTPGFPVSVDGFVGRKAEVERLAGMARSAAHGKLQVAFLAAERGMGKSSLATFVRVLAERDYNLLTVHAFLGGVTSLEEMVRRIFDRLVKDSIDKSWAAEIKQFFGDHVREVGLFGITVELQSSPQDLTHLVNDFAPALRRLLEKIGTKKTGVMIVLDDLNGLADSPDFANWLKSLVDEIATSQAKYPVFLLAVGLEERRQELLRNQPSLDRVFQVVDLRPWSDEETRDFFQRSFASVGVSVHGGALAALAAFTEGLPVIAHELGDAVFNVDQDKQIDTSDVLDGMDIAADVIGRKQLEPVMFSAVRSDRYRKILRAIAESQTKRYFKRAEVLSQLSSEDAKVFDNFLQRMKQVGVLVQDQDSPPGSYRFATYLYGVYFNLEAERAKREHS
ncbi:MAG: ATP-binding protein [Acidobacteriota bacterium]